MPKFNYVAMDAKGKEVTGTWKVKIKPQRTAASGRWDISPPVSSKPVKMAVNPQ